MTKLRGTLTPTNSDAINSYTAEDIQNALKIAGLERAVQNFNLDSISNLGRIKFDSQYASAGTSFTSLYSKMRFFVNLGDMRELSFSGILIVVIETHDDLPEIFQIQIDYGTTICKTGIIQWESSALF